jgi:hypothetical protein
MKLKLCVIGIAALLMLSGTAISQTYAFGTMQRDKTINIVQGDTFTTPLYFYNVFGDRITHVTGVSVSGDHPEWVKIEPEAHLAQYEVKGAICNVTESLAVEPKGYVLKNESTTPPEGWGYIQAPARADSWIPARPVNITFTVPKDAKLGTYSFRVSASGYWFPETGCAIETTGAQIGQSRDFDYTINVLYPGQYYEKPYVPTTPAPAAPSLLETQSFQYIAFAVIVVAAMAGMYYLGKRKK